MGLFYGSVHLLVVDIIILFLMVSVVNLETKRSEGFTDWGRCLMCEGEGERITSTVEMSRNTEMERGVPEEEMATHQRGSSN